MKAKITSNNTADIVLSQCLDCRGNNTKGFGGFRDKIEAFGLTFTESKKALLKEFKGKFQDVIISKTIETIDFELLKKEIYPFELSFSKLDEKDYYDSITDIEVPLSFIKISKKKTKK